MKFFFLALILVSCASNSKEKEEKISHIYFKQGTKELVEKNYTFALTNLLKAAEHDPQNTEIQNNLGMAYYFKKRPDKALTHLNEALKIDPKNIDAKANIATIYMETGDLKKAETIYKNIIEKELTYPYHFKTYYNLGLIEEKRNHPEKARVYYKKSIEESSIYCPPRFKIGSYLMEIKKYKQALAHFKAASNGACSETAEPHYNQALAHLKLKEYDSARFKFQEIISRFPDSPYKEISEEKLASFRSIINKLERN